MAAEGARAVTSRVFSAYGPPIDIVTSFEYLGRVILAVQDDWLAVIQKMVKARMVWRRMSSILSREEVKPWVSRFFFKAVIQSVFIFGAETWVVTPLHGTGPGGFPTPGGMANYGADSMAEAGQKGGVHLGEG